ncbi:hypothetical protein ACQ4PT_062205 [Festuca glaucescens]
MYESEDEEGEEGDDREVDSRRWNPLEEGEDFVEPDKVLRRIEPGSLPVYCRGISTLPDQENWRNVAGEIMLIATGTRTFKYKDDVKPPRIYLSILGCLIRKHFPGFVDLPTGGKSIAWTWRHYKYAEDPEGVFENAQHRVIRNFFEYFVPDPEHPILCVSVARAIAMKQVQDMHYEGRVCCVCNWYTEKRKIPISKKQAQDMTMQPWQYMQVPPQYVGLANKEVFTAMVRYWTGSEFKKKHDDGVKRRAEMGVCGCHRQGSLSLTGHIQKEKRETGKEPIFFNVWKKKRTLSELDPDRRRSMWVSDGAELWNTKYCEKLEEVRGPDVDPLTTHFDPEVAMLAGQGKRNGRLWIGDGSIDNVTIPSIHQLRHGRTSSQSQREIRPMPSSVAMERIQVCPSSLVIYILLQVFHCNIHDIASTNVGSGGGVEQTARGGRGQSSANGGADDAVAAASGTAAEDDGVNDRTNESAARSHAHA